MCRQETGFAVTAVFAGTLAGVAASRAGRGF
jgi:hypothetical protein